MSNKKDKYKINYSTYVSGGRAVGKSGSYKKGSTGIKGAISSAGSSISRFANGDGSRNSSESNINLDYNVKKYMGQRGGTFGDKSYTKIGDDFYLKANPYSGIDMKKNNKPTLLKENQYNVSEENREKINKGKIESYIKGINPYSAPPKNIRDAKAKESVESLMNSIQKKKNTVFKNQSEDNERGITDQGISQVTSNIKPYGMDQRSAVNTKNNSLYQAYPSYGSRVTSSDIQRINDNSNNFVKQRNEKELLRQQIQNEKKANAKPIENVSDVSKYVMDNYYRQYGVDQRSGMNSKNDVLFSDYPTYGSRVTNEDIQRINDNANNFVKQRDEKAVLRKQMQANKEKMSKLTNGVTKYYYVPNGKFNKDEFDQKMADYKKYSSSDVGNFRQNVDSSDKHVKDVENVYPIYGSKMSINDVNALNKKYDGVITSSEEDAKYYKELLRDALWVTRLSDYYKRKHYLKENTKTAIPDETINEIMNNRVDYGDYAKAIPDDIVGKNKIGINLNPPYISDKIKDKEVEKLENDFGKDKLEDNLNKFGGQDLPFETPLALSIYPEFSNQSLNDIENMSVDQRKMVYILAKAKGQKVADKYARYLIPEQVKNKSDEAYNFLNNNGGISLLGLGGINEINRSLDGLKQTLNLIIGNNKTPVDDTVLNSVINKIREKGSKRKKILLDLLDTGHSSIEDAIMTFFTGGAGAKAYGGARSLGESYSDRMHSAENDGSLKYAEKAQNEAVFDAIKDVVLGHFMDKYSDEIIKNLKGYNINIPD
ncbi:hypothetical protein [Anaerofustis stercorihominis]|uniref:hypothetical protein n=1 Tax=Anaerofustis stercorihominis TaxID=214853 RepID=UPI001106508C|nr:hypothetical protein [Anaerofustis stercorihominis]